MKLAGFGAPSDIIEDLLSGVFKPRVKAYAALRSRINQRIYRNERSRQEENLLASGITEDYLEDILNWTPEVVENDDSVGSGEISVEKFDEDAKKEVENYLKSLAARLHSRLSERLKILPISLSAMEAFAGSLNWAKHTT